MNDEVQSIIVDEIVQNVEEWDTAQSETFGLMNEWANSYRMIDTRKEKRPNGFSRTLSAETPKAVNALAESMTRMQTLQDPNFELISEGASEEQLFTMEREYKKELRNFEFKRNLLKGNRSLCLFGTQIWEEPYVKSPENRPVPSYYPIFSGTAFLPLSLLQFAFRPTVYDIKNSDFVCPIYRIHKSQLMQMANSGDGIWNSAAIEEAIRMKGDATTTTNATSSIDTRRQSAGYQDVGKNMHDLFLYHGRPSKEIINTAFFQRMWVETFGRTDDPRYCDITFGLLDKKYLVRAHPTPYCSWTHLYKIGHYIESELEAYAYGVGKYGNKIQKDLNMILSLTNDVEIFSLCNMFLWGDNSVVDSTALNIIPWGGVKVRDINQVRELRPQIEGIINGIKLAEYKRDEFRGVTHASDTLQAVVTGATAHETSLAQGEAMRAVGLSAEVNGDMVIRPHYMTMHVNRVDQNPLDTRFIRDVDFEVRITTDRDFRPEHSKQLLQAYNAVTTIRGQNPIDFDPFVLLKPLVRSLGVDPRELNKKRPQIDRLLAILGRVNADSDMKQAMLGELAGLEGKGDGNVSNVPAQIPSPASGQAGELGVI